MKEDVETLPEKEEVRAVAGGGAQHNTSAADRL
jgi:hypothetical protein